MFPNYWSITMDTYNSILELLPEGGAILEIGSGDATEVLAKKYKMYSIEHSLDYLNKYDSIYLYAPMVDCTEEKFPYRWSYFYSKKHIWPTPRLIWYDPDILKKEFDRVKPEYDLLLIDGPNENRPGLLSHISLFNLDVPVVIDDLHCAYIQDDINPSLIIAEYISSVTNRPLEIITTETGYSDNPVKKYGVIRK